MFASEPRAFLLGAVGLEGSFSNQCQLPASGLHPTANADENSRAPGDEDWELARHFCRSGPLITPSSGWDFKGLHALLSVLYPSCHFL